MVEKRSHQRVSLGTQVTCRRANGETFTGKGRDISIGGMFIECTEAVSFGDELSIELELPTAKQHFMAPAIVRWMGPGGFGVQFGLMGARETHAISELLRG